MAVNAREVTNGSDAQACALGTRLTGQLPPAEQRAAELRGFGPAGVLAIAAILLTGNIAVTRTLIVPVGAMLVLLWARWSRTPWSDLGFIRPTSWVRTIAVGSAIGIVLKLFMKSVVMPQLGADPVNQAFHFLQGNPALVPATLFSMVLGAGFGEETVFRGWMFERLQRLFGWTPAAKSHIAFNLTAYALIYWNLESGVAEFFG